YPPSMTRSSVSGQIAALAVLISALLIAFAVGRYPISPGDAVSVIAAQLTGAALAVARTAFQALFRNPLVSPDLLGASSGAALGAVIGIYFSLGVLEIQAFAFIGGLIAVAAVYLIGSAMSPRDPVLVLVLTGVVIGALLGAGVG